MIKSGEKKSIMKHLDFILADFIILELSYFAAYFIRFRLSGLPDVLNGNYYRHQALILGFCLVVSLTFGNPYQDILKRNKYEETYKTLQHAINMFLVDVICLYFIHEAGALSRVLMAFTWIFYCMAELLFRFLWKRHLRRKYMRQGGKEAMIVLSSSAQAGGLVRELLLNPLCGYFIAAVFLTDYSNTGERMQDLPDGGGGNVPVLGGEEELIEYASHNWVDEAFLDLGTLDESGDKPDLRFTLEQMGITTYSALAKVRQDAEEEENQTIEVSRISSYIVTSGSVRVVPGVQRFLKRGIDIIGGIVGCILAVILAVIIGPIIYLQSPGSIIFSQERVGKNGRLFRMYKFRSMYPDADRRKVEFLKQNQVSDGMMFKLENDPRIIGSEKKGKDGRPKGIGNFIRRTSIDEFPQFFNVLKGEMSLVGTRPPTVDEWKKYKPRHRARMSMRPGITGMWQISGRSDVVDFDKVVELDMQYIRNWTIGMDIRILWRTIKAVIKQSGAR